LIAADKAIDTLAFHDVLAAVNDLVGAVNGCVSEQEPWKVAKDPDARARLVTILDMSAEVLRRSRSCTTRRCRRAPPSCGRPCSASRLGPRLDQRVQDASAWGPLPGRHPH
jgi:methionyl-tRNA synthetase